MARREQAMTKGVKSKRPKKEPLRSCLGCGAKRPKKELIRVVRIPSGGIEVDLTGRKAGRGAYVCPGETCLEKAVKGKRLERALEAPVPDEVLASLAAAAAAAAPAAAPTRKADAGPVKERDGRDPMKG